MCSGRETERERERNSVFGVRSGCGPDADRAKTMQRPGMATPIKEN